MDPFNPARFLGKSMEWQNTVTHVDVSQCFATPWICFASPWSLLPPVGENQIAAPAWACSLVASHSRSLMGEADTQVQPLPQKIHPSAQTGGNKTPAPAKAPMPVSISIAHDRFHATQHLYPILKGAPYPP